MSVIMRILSFMTAQAHGRVPTITLGWRLKIALGEADFKAEDMADALGVSRQTVSRWMAGHGSQPRPIYVDKWADLCDVDPSWLLTGVPSVTPPTGPRRQRADELRRHTARKRPRAEGGSTRRYVDQLTAA